MTEDSYGVAAGELRQFIEQFEQFEQFEQMDAEKRDIAEQQKELMTEAKARGYDTKVMRKVIAIRRHDHDHDDVAEEEAILDMYKAALGLSDSGCPRALLAEQSAAASDLSGEGRPCGTRSRTIRRPT